MTPPAQGPAQDVADYLTHGYLGFVCLLLQGFEVGSICNFTNYAKEMLDPLLLEATAMRVLPSIWAMGSLLMRRELRGAISRE